MPYFKEIGHAVEQLQHWADLRREQGVHVQPIIARAHKAIAAAMRDLRTAEPPPAMRRREPDALEDIRKLRPSGPRRFATRLSPADLRDRMRGAWLGRAAGCMLGVPVEGWSVADMEALARRTGTAFPPETYWKGHPRPDEIRYETSPIRAYLEGNIRAIEADDDLAYTLIGLLILEQCGPQFTTDDVGRAWLDFLPIACTAEQVVLENLKAGVPATRAATQNNPYLEWIGADIRSDPWGYAAPGWPERAAEMAYRDASLSHRGNGVYGAMLFAAAIAAAFVVDAPLEAIRIGLTEIPRDCRLARDVRWALQHCPNLRDWREARALVDARFDGMNWVHTNNNACLTVFGLHLGNGDFTRTIGFTVAMGLDNDCTGATAGSITGAILGAGGIPEHWQKPLGNRTRTYLRGHATFRNDDIARRFVRLAQRLSAQSPHDSERE